MEFKINTCSQTPTVSNCSCNSALTWGFPLAEWVKQKTFFSHTAGSLSASVWGVWGHVACTRFSFCFPVHRWMTCPNHLPMKQFRVYYNCKLQGIYSPTTFLRCCKTVVLLYNIVMLIKVRLHGLAWHSSQQCVRNCTWIAGMYNKADVDDIVTCNISQV